MEVGGPEGFSRSSWSCFVDLNVNVDLYVRMLSWETGRECGCFRTATGCAEKAFSIDKSTCFKRFNWLWLSYIGFVLEYSGAVQNIMA